ncbi:MAG: GNAT family N-acetyltransferase [Burkholderiaceae bacterium]|nr:GNAT family N-acetyltransferase [Burkholderiaceae bacterium]
MNTINVRQAVAADIEALAGLFDQYRQFQGEASNIAAARSFLAERFNHGESVVFIATVRDAAVGFAQLYPSFSSVALARVFVLNDLFVLEAARGRRIASELLSAVESYAWSFGASRVTLNVARTNVSAQQVYIARGWKQDDQFFMFHRFPADK